MQVNDEQVEDIVFQDQEARIQRCRCGSVHRRSQKYLRHRALYHSKPVWIRRLEPQYWDSRR